jgi:ATP-binding cassette subfamily F protein 3
MRVALAAVLFSEPDYLLLDEPTNYLDLEGALWLENYLMRYPHTVIIISHDRQLLNRAVGAILHLENKGLTYYSGPYDQFARQRAAQRAVQAAQAKKQELRRAHLQGFVDRFKAKASKAKQAQSRVKMLEKMETIRAPEDEARTRFTFPEPEELASPIISTENVSVGYDGKSVLRGLDLRIDQDDRIALLGQNGQGKTTLAKLLSDRLKAMSGKMTSARKLRIGFFAQHQVEELDVNETPLQHLVWERPDEAPSRLRARLAGFGLGPDQAETPVGRLSGGQRARLSLLLATLPAPHLLILDEPTNHLDIESREALVEALTTYSGAVILVSHDMHLLSMVADRLWLVHDGAVTPYDDDLAAYRQMHLKGTSPKKDGKKEGKKAAKNSAPVSPNNSQDNSQVKSLEAAKPANHNRLSREEVLSLRKNARSYEERVQKLAGLRKQIVDQLGNKEFYSKATAAQAETMQKKYAEVVQAMDKAEELWMAALEKLENAA